MKQRLLLSLALASSILLHSGQQIALAQRRTPPAVDRAKAAQFDRARYSIRHQKFVLDNGLTLLVHEDHSVPIVGVNLWYHVGSRNEKRGKTGFAHLFEHFFFNGSENYPHGFREAMDDLGANNRNGTTEHRPHQLLRGRAGLGARAHALPRSRPHGLPRRAHLEGDARARARRRAEREAAGREPALRPRLLPRSAGKLYPSSHPYSWSTIGSMDDLNAASLEDVKEWYRTYYGPNNAVLSLAGDITPERALELVKKYFGGIPPGPPLPRTEQWVPRLDRNIRDEMEDRVPQARIYRVYHAPAWRDARDCSTSRLLRRAC